VEEVDGGIAEEEDDEVEEKEPDVPNENDDVSASTDFDANGFAEVVVVENEPAAAAATALSPNEKGAVLLAVCSDG